MAWPIVGAVAAGLLGMKMMGDAKTEQAKTAAEAAVKTAEIQADAKKTEAQQISEARQVEAKANAEARKTEAVERNDARRTEAEFRHDATVHESNNQLRETQIGNQTQQMAIMTNSKDFQFQVLAWMTQQLESLDVKEAIAFKDADIRAHQIRSEERVEKGKIKVDEHEVDARIAEAKKDETVSTGSFLS